MGLKDRLKIKRMHLRLTQQKLADLAGVTQATIQCLESGRNRSSTYLLEISGVLGVTPQWLAYGDDKAEWEEPVHYTPEPIPDIHQIDNVFSYPVLKFKDIKNFVKNKILPRNNRSIFMFKNDYELNENSFFIELQKDEMQIGKDSYNSIYSKEIALIDVTIKPKSGDFVLAEINNQYIKVREYVEDGNEALLIPTNESLPVIKIDDDVDIVGVIVMTQRIRTR